MTHSEPVRTDTLIRLRDDLLKRLSAAQTRRSATHGDGWILHERETMCDAVNLHRQRLGKQPIAIDAVERVENQAVGHSDYSSKFALYCAELVLEERR